MKKRVVLVFLISLIAVTILTFVITPQKNITGFSVSRDKIAKENFVDSNILRNVSIVITGSNIIIDKVIGDELKEIPPLSRPIIGVFSDSISLNNNESIIFSYFGLDYEDVNKLEIVRCGKWNHKEKSCLGSWKIIDSSIDKNKKKIRGSFVGHGTYFLVENKCGNGLCEKIYGETPSTCANDCITIEKPTTSKISRGGGKKIFRRKIL